MNDKLRLIAFLCLSVIVFAIPSMPGCHNTVETAVVVIADEVPLPTFQPGISIALALATIGDVDPTPEPKPAPAPDGKTKCENCNGVGKVGDGRTMIECPVCKGKGYTEPEADPAPEVAPPVPAMPEAKEPVGRKRVLFFTAEWCGPCLIPKSHLKWYENGGWKVGWTRDCHIQLVDIDKDPGARDRYRAHSIPVFVVVDAKGKELARSGWTGDRLIFANLLNGTATEPKEPPPAPPAEEPPSPIQTYEVPREWIPQPPPMTARERLQQRIEQRRAERRARYGR